MHCTVAQHSIPKVDKKVKFLLQRGQLQKQGGLQGAGGAVTGGGGAENDSKHQKLLLAENCYDLSHCYMFIKVFESKYLT